MIQYIKFATYDPEGFAIVKAEDISGVVSTIEPEQCKVITKHGEYLVAGTIEYHVERFQTYFGGEWESIPGADVES